MGTKIHCESYLPVHHSMRDLNEDSSSSSWPLCCGDKTVTNGQYYNGYMPRATVDLCPGNNKDALKQKMLEHESVFKDQVNELHRLYRRQRDIMEEARRNESAEPSSSSSLRGSQIRSEDAWKWYMSGFPLSNSHSPMSCNKGNSQPPSQIPYHNGSMSKDPEALGTRPLKLRKKLFNLQLPPDQCVDLEEGEKSPAPEVKVSDFSSYVSKPNLRTGHAESEPDCRMVAPSSASRLRNSTGLADLNEPSVIEEAVALSPPALLSHSSRNGETRGLHVGVNGGNTHDRNGFLIDSVGSKLYEAGSCRSNHCSSNNGFQQNKFAMSSHPMQSVFNLTNHPSGNYSSGRCREDSWRMGSHQSSQAHVSYPFFGSCLAGSYPQPSSSRTKQKSSSTQKMTTLETASFPSQVPWRVGASGTLYQHMGGEPMKVNGFYQESTSGCKDLKAYLSSGFDYCTNAASNQINIGFGNFQKGSCHVDSKPVLDINLNEDFSKESVNEADLCSRNGKGKQEVCLPTLPWLKHKPADRLCSKTETLRDLNQPIVPEVAALGASSDGEVLIKTEAQSVTKILGVPVFDTGALEKKLTSNVSILDCRREMDSDGKDRKRRIIDINLECVPEAEEEVTGEKEKRAKVGSSREYIDLNSCASDCEDLSVPSFQSQAANVKTMLEIDLEAPAVLDEDLNAPFKLDTVSELSSLQSKTEELNDEVAINAAETMVAVSLFCPQVHMEEGLSPHPEASLAESLLQFADALFNGSVEEIDEFEAMTLQQEETKEEDYMPEPFLPEIHNIEEPGANALSTRPRRGQARRGRQRRDFQRDILPGLTTLSRHEVTEDLQIFTGVMRATGYYWTSGLTRRNGSKTRGGRGRQRFVAEPLPAAAIPIPACTQSVRQVSNIEAGLEDRTLNGWGKMPRRPRRQRCPNGNPPAVVLT